MRLFLQRWRPRLLSIDRRRIIVALLCMTLLGAVRITSEVIRRARLISPPPSRLLLDREHRFLGEIGGDDSRGYGYWELSEIPDRVAMATILVEDRRFRSHHGVDFKAICRAAWQNISHAEVISGASTLAMQVARMQHPERRSLFHKGMESLIAMVLTAREGRNAVLRHYLRIVPYGNRIHGIAYAARRYLDKPVKDLSWAEVAFLAAIPQSPSRMNPLKLEGRNRAINRGLRILELLRGHGQLKRREYHLACAEIRRIEIPEKKKRPIEALHAVFRIRDLLDSGEIPASGPILGTTIDLELQREASRMVSRALSRWEKLGAGNAALIVLDRLTAEVLTWVGSGDYFDDLHDGAIDYALVPRSPGSTLKPFIYAAALDRGVISPATILDDLQRGPAGISNSDLSFMGPLLPRVALANSRNVPAANLLAHLGLQAGYRILEDLGLHDGSFPARQWGLGLVIGNMPLSLEKLMQAYTSLAGDGRLRPLRWRQGRKTIPGKRVFSEDAAREITLFLSDPMARLPTFSRMGNLEYPFPVAVKTGTSSGYHDSWTIAWSRRYLVGAWVGHPSYRSMRHLTGGRAAGKLVHSILMLLHSDDADGMKDVGFPPPRGWEAASICPISGKLAGPACDREFLEYFPPGEVPHESCDVHLRLGVDRRNGLLATRRTPAEEVEVHSFAELPQRYARWQAAAGIPTPPREISPLGSEGPSSTAPDPMRPASHPQRLAIVSPLPGGSFFRDPETPPELSTLPLEAVVDPPSEQLLWYIDGRPFKLVDNPYTARWPLSPGVHSIQIALPFRDIRSSPVRITVF